MNEAKILREDFEAKLKKLQDECPHTESEWLDFMWAPGHFFGKVRSCKRCEKILEYPKPVVVPEGQAQAWNKDNKDNI